jgi:peptidoglycan/xylan/chitin deacetylase (PgdA/CDA1 family)
VVTLLAVVAWTGACGDAEPGTPQELPASLTAEERAVWAPLPPDRSAIPVLLYHGIGPADAFSNPDDAAYGVDADHFAKQMSLIAHAGYRTVDLRTFLDFVAGREVELPPRPLLLTFDDARLDSWTGADEVLDQLGFRAVLFVDVGRVVAGDPEYLTWEQLRDLDGDRWEVELHSGEGHTQIRFGPGDDDFGPFYAYLEQGEDFDGWQHRVRSDIEWGQRMLERHLRSYRPLAFAPPYGNYGQDGTNHPEIPVDLLAWLVDRFGTVFTQDVNARATPGSGQPLGRIQVTRSMTGGELHDLLLSG